MRYRGTWVAVACAVAMVVVGMLPSGCATKDADNGGTGADKSPYAIGAVLSLTGAQSSLGLPEKNVIEMEVDRINAAGGINGHPLVVIIEDDASDVDQAVAATTKLIEQDEVLAIVGSTGTGQTMAMRAEIDLAGVPQVSLAGSLVITQEFDQLVFQTPWSNALVAPATLQYLKDEGFTKIGLITEDTGFGKDGKTLINGMAAEYGLTVVSDQVFKPTDTDMSGQLTVIKGAGADVVVMWSSVAASSIVPKNMEQLGMDIPLVGSHGIARKEFVDSAGAAAEGAIMFAGKILAPEAYGEGSEGYKVATEYIARYTETYGEPPTSTFAGHAYDGLHLVVEAMKRLDEGFTPADLRDEIERTDGFVGIGGTFTFSATDHNGMSADDLVGYVVKDGAWSILE